MFQERFGQRMDKAIIQRLIFIGETFVRNARLNGDYNDITGNLRASIGYLILHNGVEVAIGGFVGSLAGVAEGQAYIRHLASNPEYQKGYVLIGVAGMQYAAQVESRGRDVITGSSIEAENQLRTAFASLGK